MCLKLSLLYVPFSCSQCSSSLQAIANAAAAIQAGTYEMYWFLNYLTVFICVVTLGFISLVIYLLFLTSAIAAGVESMSQEAFKWDGIL